MQQQTTFYKKHGSQILFWKSNFNSNKTISFTWGIVGYSVGSRIKGFESYEETLQFYEAFTNRMTHTYSYKPNECKYRMNVTLKNHPNQLQKNIEEIEAISKIVNDVLCINGIGYVKSLELKDDLLSIPFNVINTQIAFNKIREELAGIGISRNHLLFLPR